MTYRIRTVTVVLDQDYRKDDAELERILNALKMVKSVSSVTPDPVTATEAIARAIAKSEFRIELKEFIEELLTPDL